jgi:DNA-binding response OmpR family regulator
MPDPTFNTGYGMSALRTSEVDPLSIADGRITFGPRIGELVVEKRRLRIPPRAFHVGYMLAENVDETVSNDALVERMSGFDASTISKNNLKDFRRAVDTDIYHLRQKFGEDLGDIDYGAFRTIFKVGYVALSEL